MSSTRNHDDDDNGINNKPLYCDAFGMHRRAVGEHNGWTKRGARTWIAPRDDGSHVIAARIEAGNGLSIAGEHLRIGARRKSRADRNVGRQDRKRIERRRTYGADAARIGLVGGIAVKTIEFGFTLVEIDINTGLGKTIVTRDREVTIASDLYRPCRQALRASAGARRDNHSRRFPRIAMARVDDAQAIFAMNAASQISQAGIEGQFVALKHCQDEVMI